LFQQDTNFFGWESQFLVLPRTINGIFILASHIVLKLQQQSWLVTGYELDD
jgi:hypothetical protein